MSTVRTSVPQQPAPDAPELDRVSVLDPLVEESRQRPSAALTRREGFTAAASSALYLLVAVAMAVESGVHASGLHWLVAGMFIVTYAAVSRIEFEIGTGSVVPTELVLVPMLFVLPVATVPLAVGIAYAAGAMLDVATGNLRWQRLPVVLSTCWHAVGPAAVLAVWGSGYPTWNDLPVYVVALLAQFGFDLVSSVARESLGFGLAPSKVLAFLRPVFLVDALLAPIGLLAAFAIAPAPLALLAVLPLVALLWVFARDRRGRIDQALALSRAYHGASDQARHDRLTGLLNRLGWDEVIAAHQEPADAAAQFSVIVLDLDGLKDANDVFGHEFGDAVIRTMAHVLARAVREDDVVARLGGDEFAVLMPGCGESECRATIRRVSETISRKRVGTTQLAASIGGATCFGAEGIHQALRRADARMYQAKRRSRSSRAQGLVDRRSQRG